MTIQQNNADVLKAAAEKHRPRNRAALEEVYALLERFERAEWDAGLFDSALMRAPGSVRTGQDGLSEYMAASDTYVEIGSILTGYLAAIEKRAPTLLGSENAAAFLGISIATMKRWIADGRVVGQLIGHVRVFTRAELEAFKAEGERPKLGRPKGA